MTDNEKKLVVDAVVKIADMSAEFDAVNNTGGEISSKISVVTKKLCKELDIAEEVDGALSGLILKNMLKALATALKCAPNDGEDDDDEEEGEDD
jgi:hypothetical protein